MARKNRTPPDAIALGEALKKRPHRFGFYAVLRRYECIFKTSARFGESQHAKEDPIRLAQTPSLAFATSTLARFEERGEAKLRYLVGNFFGLYGPHGPLPAHITEYARDRMLHHGDRTLVGFLDIFHHRMMSLFYRAWANSQPVVQFDRPETDQFSQFVASLLGMGVPAMRRRDSMPDSAKFFYAGQTLPHTRHAEGLHSILADFFRLPVRIREFVGEWLPLPMDARCRLGETTLTGTLGVTAVAGERVWDCQHKFRIVVGPLRLEEYRRLLPGGDSLRRLVDIVRNYTSDEYEWDLQLLLERHEIPSLHLGDENPLGWSSWMNGDEENMKEGDLILSHLVERVA